MSHTAGKNILAVFPLAPWPVREHGFSIRFYPVLQSLSERHQVDVVVLGDHRRSGLPDDPLLKRVKAFPTLLNFRPKPALWRRLPKIATFLNPLGPPRAMVDYHENDAFEALKARLLEQRYDVVLWAGAAFRDVLDRLRPLLGGARVVWDCVDSPFLLESRKKAHRSLLGEYELWKVRRWERSRAISVDQLIYVSPVDAMACYEGVSPAAVIPNGIFAADYEVSAQAQARTIGYLGHMSYGPNVEAAQRLHLLFRKLKSRGFSDVKLKIIGRAPAPEIVALAAHDVEVTGEVSSIWPHVQQVTAFVFPLSSGAGLQNKILEAMYAGRPVITTDICNQSLGAESLRHLVVASSDDDIVEAMAMLLSDDDRRTKIADEGKAFVRERYSLGEITNRYERVLCGEDL